MFKKTLLALAVTGFVGAATAATIPQTKVSFSAEGAANDVTVASSLFSEVTVLAGIDNGYAVGDKLVFTFPNDVFDISTTAAFADGDGAGSAGVDIAVGAPAYSDGNTVSFTITSVTNNVETDNQLILSGIVLEGANVSGGGSVEVDFSVISSVNNTAYEKVSAVLADSATQISSSVSPALAKEVDVSKSRSLFVGGGVTDTFTVTAVDNTAGVIQDATVNSIKYTLNGDFSFLDADGDGDNDYTVTVTNAADEAVAADGQSVTWSHTAAAAHVVVITASDLTTPTLIPVQEFTVDSVVSYDPATLNTGGTDSTKSFSASAGEWTLNGDSAYIPFMPFSSDFAQSVSIANTGSVDGEITIDITANGNTNTHVLTTVAKAMSVTNITSGIKAAAIADGVTGNAAINVVTNSPSGDVTVSALYYSKADGDRGIVAVTNQD